AELGDGWAPPSRLLVLGAVPLSSRLRARLRSRRRSLGADALLPGCVRPARLRAGALGAAERAAAAGGADVAPRLGNARKLLPVPLRLRRSQCAGAQEPERSAPRLRPCRRG